MYTIWREYTKQKDEIYTRDYDERDESDERQRTIWVNEEFQDWCKYITGKTENYLHKQEYGKRKQDRKKLATELGKTKNTLKEIRTKWKNEYIRIITQDIREGQKKGNARIVWQKINEMKNKTKKKQGNMVLTDENGNTQSETQLNLEVMRKYTNQHFYRKREQ